MVRDCGLTRWTLGSVRTSCPGGVALWQPVNIATTVSQTTAVQTRHEKFFIETSATGAIRQADSPLDVRPGGEHRLASIDFSRAPVQLGKPGIARQVGGGWLGSSQ